MKPANELREPQGPYHLQCTDSGQLKHFLSINGLSKATIIAILDMADSFIEVGERAIKKVPLLRGKTVVNLFFEPSTRTRTTFELAAKRLSADVINLDINRSSTSKGETLSDTLQNLRAMASDMFIVRHQQSGAAAFIAQSVTPDVAIVNAGDGCHAHPTQALLDMLTIRQNRPDFSQLKVAIVGDILHSRVARSQIRALNILGAKEIRVIGPKSLLPSSIARMGVNIFHQMTEGLSGVDVVIMLRLQKERMSGAFLPSEREYYRLYGLDEKKFQLADERAIVMHPGPINRGVEISSDIADSEHSVILDQVTNGIAVRMAVMAMVMSGQIQARHLRTKAGQE